VRLRGGPRERDPGAAAGRLSDREPLRLESGGDLVDIVLAQPKSVSILFRGEPLMIEG